jgi:hypothetical protein
LNETNPKREFSLSAQLFPHYTGDTIMNKHKSILIGIALLLISGTVFAFTFPPRVSWNPAALKPASIAPGSTASFQFTLTNTGFLLIPATNQLRIVAEGNIAPFITFTQPTFPPVFKRGNQVTIQVHVSAPATTAYLRTSGRLVLQRVLPNGKVKEVWRADALPAQLTFSSISLPPYPDPAANNATLEGIDYDLNEVRDDIDHYLAETYPNSAKVREALKQEARALTPFLVDAGDRVQSRENAIEWAKGMDCSLHVFGNNVDLDEKAHDELLVQFLNTKERSRAYNQADAKLGGTSSDNPEMPLSQYGTRCSFDPNSLPN